MKEDTMTEQANHTDHTPATPTTPERVLASAFDEAKRGNAGVVWWQDIIRTPSWRTIAAALTRGLAGSGDVGALRSALEVGLNRIKGECRGDFGTPSVAAIEDLADTLLAALAAVRAETLAGSGVGLTHGRHCPCTPCREENWTNPELAHCGMHGPSCPPVYDPYPTTATPPTPALTAARLEPHWHARTCWRRAMPETMDHRCSCGLDAAVAALGTGTDWCRYAMGAEVCGWPPSGKMHGTGPDQHPFQPAHATPEEAER